MKRRAGTATAVAVVVLVSALALWAVTRPSSSDVTDSPNVTALLPVPSHAAGHRPVPASPDSTPHSTPHSTAASLYEQTRDDLLGVLAQDGPRAALAALEQRIHDSPGVSGLCHAVAHDLGHAALDRAQGRASVALKARNDVCGGGYTHGIIEMALGESTRPGRDLLRVCAPRQDGSCFHGVGHGLMFATSMDVGRSLGLCDRAPNSILSHRCAEGVFMQLFSGDAAAGHQMSDAVITPSQARERCAGTRADYAANCWFYAPNAYLTQAPDDFAGAMDWCAGAGSSIGRSTCARGTGSRTVKYHPEDLSIGEGVCAHAGTLARDCVGGMASYWSVHWKGERSQADLCHRLQRQRMRALCEDAT